MKRSAFLLGLLASFVWAQTLTQGERDYAMSQLHATRKMLLDAIAGLSPAQWKFKPATEAWSIGQYVEHVILAEDHVRQHVEALLKKPPASERQSALDNDTLYSRAADPDQPPTIAGPAVEPKGRYATAEQAAQAFRERRDRTIAYIASTSDPLRAHADGNGPDALDAYQWFIRLAGHTERCVARINRIKAERNFPSR
jgi:hypothetical protein